MSDNNHMAAARAAASALRAARRANDPHMVGPRTLLAKTCKTCGELRPGRAFKDYRNVERDHRGGRYGRECRRCEERRGQRAKRINDSMPQPRKNYQWTGPELEVIERDDLTARQAGAMIGRSVYAVRTMQFRVKREVKLQRVLGAQT